MDPLTSLVIDMTRTSTSREKEMCQMMCDIYGNDGLRMLKHDANVSCTPCTVPQAPCEVRGTYRYPDTGTIVLLNECSTGSCGSCDTCPMAGHASMRFTY